MEDRIVKYFFKNLSENKSISRYVPVGDQKEILFNLVKKKAIVPSEEEINNNFPSRSAKLRVAVRNNNKFYYPEELISKFKKYLDLESLNV